MGSLAEEVQRRRTFAIISHPDAGKTTLTERLLVLGGAIQVAGTVKARKSSRHARSDWLEIEKQRGISVTSSVMQFIYRDTVINLLDTPGHGDFSEDTYRTLTAVDAALMVIDAAKGVEERTVKLMEVCRLRKTPIITFINKLDRDAREPLDLLDEIETVLGIRCAPLTWPIGSGKLFAGVCWLNNGEVQLYRGKTETPGERKLYPNVDAPEVSERLGARGDDLREELDLVMGAGHEYEQGAFLRGELTPVFFGSALNNFGIADLLDYFVESGPPPQIREAVERDVDPTEEAFSGFVFKIQANMDPAHHDRIAFMRICSGHYRKGMKMRHLRVRRDITPASALSFLADDRDHTDSAWPGDIIGLHNHGTIRIGDTFSSGEVLKYTGIPHFAPELFRQVILKDPLRAKALQKGLVQLSEEGATQVFRPLANNSLILGAVGMLQFDVVAWRLQHEYKVDCIFEPTPLASARWIVSEDPEQLARFKAKESVNLALDGEDNLTYLAPTRVNLNLAIERWPDISFLAYREQ